MKNLKLAAMVGSLFVLGGAAYVQPAVVSVTTPNGSVSVNHQNGETTVSVTQHNSQIVNLDPPYPGI